MFNMASLSTSTILLSVICLWGKCVAGTISVISEETGDIVKIIEDRNIRSMSDALEGYVINSNPLNVCEIPDPPPEVKSVFHPHRIINGSTIPKKPKFILLGVIYDCDLTTKARNAQQSGYSGLIIQNIGTNNSHLIPWHIMRFPLAKINHVVVGEHDGYLLRYNFSYPDNGYYIKFEEDHFYQVLCYVLAGIILLLLSTMFLLFWFQVCCTIIALRLPYRVGQRFQNWLHPSKRRLTRPMLQLLPVKNWTHTDPYHVCSICQEDYKTDEKVRILPCNHAFHQLCIDPWLLKRSRRCPNCMQRVKLPTDPDDEEQESDYSSGRTHNRGRRNCSQSSLQRSSSATIDNAPLIDLPESPKNRGPGEEDQIHQEECVIVTTVEESSSNSTRDWQLKRFLQNFNYTPSSDGSRSCSLSRPSSTAKKEQSSGLKKSSSCTNPQQKSFSEINKNPTTKNPHSTVVTTIAKMQTIEKVQTIQIPQSSRKVEDSIFLETCLDIVPSTSSPQKSIAGDDIPHRVNIAAAIEALDGDNSVSVSASLSQEAPAQAQAQPQGNPRGSQNPQENSHEIPPGSSVSASSASGSAQALAHPPREYSNPGYVSFDDDGEEDSEDDDEATEEQNITSSFDATTISESLPCDDPLDLTSSHPLQQRLDNDQDENDDSVMSENYLETDSLQIEEIVANSHDSAPVMIQDFGRIDIEEIV